jgi:hypothetical protein
MHPRMFRNDRRVKCLYRGVHRRISSRRGAEDAPAPAATEVVRDEHVDVAAEAGCIVPDLLLLYDWPHDLAFVGLEAGPHVSAVSGENTSAPRERVRWTWDRDAR